MRFIYQIGANLYFFAVRIFAVWNHKAKLFMDGRKMVVGKLKSFTPNKNTYWFHCASLGEFEQARPLIEALKLKSESSKIVITFFSPSGYEIRKNYEFADLILYLPKDSKSNASLLLDSIQPSKIFFIKYEFWANYLLEANKRNIPTYLVSGVFRKKQIFFKWYGGFMRQILNSFTRVYLQDKGSKILLDSINIKSIVTGDTRFDRVMQNAKKVKKFPEIETFIDGAKCMVVGSCWPEDENVVFPTLNKTDDLKVIIAPHEINESHINLIRSSLTKKVIKFSELSQLTNSKDYDVLIIDNIGMLMHLYQYASIAYIGGAFGKGLHNILEPASFGVPVIFGDKYSKFPEAFQFINAGIGHSIKNNKEFELIFDGLLTMDGRSKVLTFMSSQKGATNQIMKDIFS